MGRDHWNTVEPYEGSGEFFCDQTPPPPPNRNNFHISKKAKCMNSVFIGIDLRSRAKDWSSLPFAFE